MIRLDFDVIGNYFNNYECNLLQTEGKKNIGYWSIILNCEIFKGRFGLIRYKFLGI